MREWDQLDAWADEQREKMRDQTPDWFTPRKDARTQAHNVARGKHPLGLAFADNGETCGTCVHRRVKEIRSGKRFRKCMLATETSGAATDIRDKWPACEKWSSK